MFNLQLFAGNDADEFSAVLKHGSNPKILITTCRFNSSVCAGLLPVFNCVLTYVGFADVFCYNVVANVLRLMLFLFWWFCRGVLLL